MFQKIRNYPIRFSSVVLAAFMLIPGTVTGSYQVDTILSENPADGILFEKFAVKTSRGTVTLSMIRVKTALVRDGRLRFEPVYAGNITGNASTTARIGRDNNAIAVLNGPYFANSGGRPYPLGFAVMSGRLAQLGNLDRAMVGIDSNGEFRIETGHPTAFITSDEYFEPVWLWGVNIPAAADAVTLYDSLWGKRVSPQGGTLVVCEPHSGSAESDVIVIDNNLVDEEEWDGRVVAVSVSESCEIPEDGYALVFHGKAVQEASRYREGSKTAIYTCDLPEGWDSMRWVTTLGPWFVHDGHARDFSSETRYESNVTGRARRSVIGLTWNDEIFFGVTGGPGLSIPETVEVFTKCNVREAVMCDSGSSSSLWVRGTGTIGGSGRIPMAFIIADPGSEESGVNENAIKEWHGKLNR